VKRFFILALLAGIFVLHGTWTLLSQTAKPARPVKAQQIAPNLHLITGEGGNVILYVTDEGAILVDNMFDRNHDGIMAQIKAITDKPLRYVLNTHQHDDHAGGDAKMLRIAEVIAHKNVRANLLDIKQPYYEDTPGTPIGIPRVTFSDEIAVALGGREVHAYYFGRGHTSGDAVILFPRERVIHTGDLFLTNGGAPKPGAPPRPPGVPIYVDSAQGGSFMEWSRTLERTLKLDFDTIVPGHGPVAKRPDMEKFLANLVTMRTRLVGLVKGGSSKAEIVKILEDDYGWRSTGCPQSPPTGGCLQYQQVDALIAELKAGTPPPLR
jgi:glyoxylase-like metal-dependent hydrolase (beta-lactamase superfamily II)